MTQYRVTMKNSRPWVDGATLNEEAVDYVGEDILESYVADARTRWPSVEFEVVEERS